VSVLGGLCVLGLLSYPHPSAWLGLAGLGVLLVGRWRLTGRLLPDSPFSLPGSLYLAGAAVGLYVSVQPHFAMVRLFGLLAAVGAFFLVLGLLSSATTARQAVSVAILATAIAAPLLLILLPPGIRLLRYPYPDLLADHAAIRDALWGMDARTQRFGVAPSGVGALAVYGLGLALGPLLAGDGRRARLLGGLAVAYFGALLIVNNNRGSLLAAALVIPLLGALFRPWLAAGVLLALSSALAVITGLVNPESMPLLGQPLGSLSGLRRTPLGDTSSLAERLDLWRDALYVLGDFPITGVGLGLGSPVLVVGTYVATGIRGFPHAHNVYLQSYLEQGLLGLLGLLSLVAILTGTVTRLVRRTRSPEVRLVSLSAGGAALSLMLAGLTDIDAVTTVGLVLLTCPLALLASMARVETAVPAELLAGRARTAVLRPGSRLALALAGLLTVFCGAAVILPVATVATLPLSDGIQAVATRIHLNLGALELAGAKLRAERDQRARQERLDRALPHIDRALGLEPDNPRLRRARAAILAMTDPAAARAELARAEELTAPGDSRSFARLARLYREVGAVDAALSSWARVDPSVGVWQGAGVDYHLVSWGASLIREGQWSAAVAVNLAAIEITPTNPAAWNAVGLALSKAVEPRAALAKLEELIASYPDVPWAYQELRNFHRRAGSWDEASVWEERVASARDSSDWTERERSAAASLAYHHRFPTGPRLGQTIYLTPPSAIADGLSQDVSAILITNRSDEVRSYASEVEFRRFDQPFAVARGTADRVRPGERRAITLLPPLPSQEAVSYGIVIRNAYSAAGRTQQTEAAEKLRMEEPTALSDLGVDVTVTNDDVTPHSFVVQAVLGFEGKFVHLLTGTVTDLEPGHPRTVTLIARRPLPIYNQVLLAVERVVD
jgi:tetratricopeptide (TPR) repeat protein